jgi:hypothetical protein
MEVFVMDKHCSLLGEFVTYKNMKCCQYDPGTIKVNVCRKADLKLTISGQVFEFKVEPTLRLPKMCPEGNVG